MDVDKIYIIFRAQALSFFVLYGDVIENDYLLCSAERILKIRFSIDDVKFRDDA